MFEKARLKLTAYYIAIIMAISFLFSVIIYQGITSEFGRFEKLHGVVQNQIFTVPINAMPLPQKALFVRFDPEIIRAAKTRIIINLAAINGAIFIFSGGASYFLAGRTLRPIKQMVDEQNRFITDASHELRTPLTSLRSEIEVALRGKKITIDESRKLLKSNLEEVIALQSLSDNLLELAQNGTLINKHNMQSVSIADIIRSSIKKISTSAFAKQVKIINKVSKNQVLVIEDRIVEVFVVLLDNAIKYSPKGSIVTISSKKEQNLIKIFVVNEGEGVNPKDLPHIFDRFYRADRARTKEGYGLGLAIAKKIIEAHGGSISAESIPGKTTTFTVTLQT